MIEVAWKWIVNGLWVDWVNPPPVGELKWIDVHWNVIVSRRDVCRMTWSAHFVELMQFLCWSGYVWTMERGLLDMYVGSRQIKARKRILNPVKSYLCNLLTSQTSSVSFLRVTSSIVPSFDNLFGFLHESKEKQEQQPDQHIQLHSVWRYAAYRLKINSLLEWAYSVVRVQSKWISTTHPHQSHTSIKVWDRCSFKLAQVQTGL